MLSPPNCTYATITQLHLHGAVCIANESIIHNQMSGVTSKVPDLGTKDSYSLWWSYEERSTEIPIRYVILLFYVLLLKGMSPEHLGEMFLVTEEKSADSIACITSSSCPKPADRRAGIATVGHWIRR